MKTKEPADNSESQYIPTAGAFPRNGRDGCFVSRRFRYITRNHAKHKTVRKCFAPALVLASCEKDTSAPLSFLPSIAWKCPAAAVHATNSFIVP